MRARFVLVGLVASLGVACQPDVFRTTLKGEATVKGSPLGGVLTAFPAIGSFTNLDFSQNQDFRAEGVTKDQVSSVRVEAISLRILSPSNQDFGFLDTIGFFARTSDAEAPIADRSDIASLGLKPPNPELALDVTSTELQPFIAAPQMSIVTRAKGRLPPQDTHLEAQVTLRVQIKLLP